MFCSHAIVRCYKLAPTKHNSLGYYEDQQHLHLPDIVLAERLAYNNDPPPSSPASLEAMHSNALSQGLSSKLPKICTYGV